MSLRTRKTYGIEEDIGVLDDRLKQRFSISLFLVWPFLSIIEKRAKYDYDLFSIKLPNGKTIKVGKDYAYLGVIALFGIVFLAFRYFGH